MSEVRTTSSTGGEKGVKLARFDLIPVGPLTELAEHYGRGARKYADHQWRDGYEWSKSYAAGMRHFTMFWSGYDYDVCSNDPGGCSFVDSDGNPYEPIDPDTCYNHTGSHHLVAVAWHAFAGLEFKDRYPEHDDRYKPQAVESEDEDLEPYIAPEFWEQIKVRWGTPETPTAAAYEKAAHELLDAGFLPPRVRFIVGGDSTEDLGPDLLRKHKPHPFIDLDWSEPHLDTVDGDD